MTSAGTPGQPLAAEATSFIGRKAELAQAGALLASTRLVTLIGPGGVGKTRLALQIARRLAKTFADGARVARLDEVSDPSLVAQTTAAQIGLRDLSKEPIDQLIGFLRDKSMLLVIDNCEHLAESCGVLVGKILADAPNVRVLATSRHVLGIESEQVMAVLPLPTKSVSSVGSPVKSDAVALLVDRVSAVDTRFTLGPHNEDAVVEICRRLDGIPLALELVASWFRILPADEVLSHLGDPYQLLRRPQPLRPTRQQTLAAAMEWSYSLCSPAEQRMWNRLSVFQGGFTLKAARHLWPRELRDEDAGVLEAIAGLVDKSILQRDPDHTIARFKMLETLREFGLRKLDDDDTLTEVRDAHLDYLVELAERFNAAWCGPRQALIAAETKRDHGNLDSALAYAFEDERTSRLGARLVVALHYYWLHCGFPAEGWRWAKQVLRVPGLPDKLRLDAMYIEVYAACALGDVDAADAVSRAATRLARAVDDDYYLGAALANEGTVALLGNDHERAESLHRQALDLLDQSDRVDMRVILASISAAMLAAFQGNPAQSAEFARRAVDLAASQGELLGRSFALYSLALAEWQAGQWQEATEHALTAIRIKRPFNDITGIAMLSELVAWIAAASGNGEHAAHVLGATHQMWKHSGGTEALGAQNWQDAHRACVTAAREQLGPAHYEAAFDEAVGACVDIGQTVSYVLATEPRQQHLNSSQKALTTSLTNRESQIAELINEGMSNKQIATRLAISPRTVTTHVENILDKLGFTSRTQIAVWVSREQDR